MWQRKLGRWAVVCLSVVVSWAAAGAQPLAERAPADAIFYVGWQGAGEMGEAYEQSRLKAVAEAWSPTRALREALSPLARQEGGPEAAEAFEAATELASALYDRPWMLYLDRALTVEGEAGATPPALVLMIDGGERADAIHGKLTRLRSVIVEEERGLEEIVVARDGSRVVLKARAMELEPIEPADSLARSERFTAALAQTGGEAVMVAYADLDALWSRIDERLADRPADRAGFDQSTEALGLRELGRAVVSGGFAERDWRVAAWLEMPAEPRNVIARLLAAGELRDETLEAIPSRAFWASAMRVELSAVIPMVRDLLGRLPGPTDPADLDEGLARIKAESGIDIEQDLFGALGDQWVLYADQTTQTMLGPGGLVIGWLEDEAAFTGALDGFERWLARRIEQEAAGPGSGPQIRLQRGEIDGVTIRYVTMPMISPAWAVHDGRFYFSINPNIISTRINLEQGGTAAVASASLPANPAYQKLIDRLGREVFQSLSYADLPATAPQTLQALGQGLPMLSMMTAGDPNGAPVDWLKLAPPTGKILPHLAPAAQVNWFDERGWHSRAISPFPGAMLLAPSNTNVSMPTAAATAGVMAGILLPALHRAREIANRAVSGANIRGLLQSMLIYAQTSDGQFPKDLGVLVEVGMASPESLMNPRLGHEAPDDLATWEEIVQWAEENSDYVYIRPEEGNRVAGHKIVLYAKIQRGIEEGINIGFGDGHVEFMTWPEAARAFRRAGQEVPAALEARLRAEQGG